MTAPANDDFSKFIGEFRNRAKKLRRNASFTIGVIVAALVFGIAAFVFAGELASREASQTIIAQRQNRFALIQGRIDATNKAINDNQEEARALERRIELGAFDHNPNSDQRSLMKQLEQRHSEAKEKDAKLRKDLEKLEYQQLSLTDEPNSTDDAIKPVAINSYSILISAIATRIGSIVLLLFLVRILVPLYRYNVRLSSYFDARADALELLRLYNRENDNNFFQKLIASLSPEAIDFAEGPPSPTQETLDFVKHLLSSQQRN